MANLQRKNARGQSPRSAKPRADRKQKKPKKKRAGAKVKRAKLTAATADRHELYQRAVQDSAFDVEFLRRAYEEARGKPPRHLREDFCGTALTAVTWVEQGSEFTADGFDLDPDVLQWGREHNVSRLGAAAERLRLFQKDVRDPSGTPADVRCAHNFSYQVFQTRRELVEYLRAARRDLAPDGVFVMDMYGGTEAVEPVEEERWVGDDEFVYIWDQDEHWPGTGEHRCYIHFRFPDGSELKRAFSYEWRLWNMPEVKEVLREVGFRKVISYFEEYDEEGDGTGEYSVNERGYACESWLAYIVAHK